MGGVVVGGQGEPRFDIADIIATHIDHPHMVLEHIRREKIVSGVTYYRNQYRLLALDTGRTTIIDIDHVDKECVLHDTLTEQQPKSFDGHMRLMDGSMAYHVREGVINLDMVPIKTVISEYQNMKHGTVGVQGGGPVGGVGQQSIISGVWNPVRTYHKKR